MMSPRRDRRAEYLAYNAAHKEERAAYRESHRAEKAAYDAAHKRDRRAEFVAYHATHKEERAAYRETHKEEIALSVAAYHEAHREEDAARDVAWKKAHPEYTRAKNSRRRIKSQINMDKLDRALSVDYRLAIAKDPCFYCGAPGEEDEHYIPIARGGTDHWWNLVRSCAHCNDIKHTMTGDEFIDRIEP